MFTKLLVINFLIKLIAQKNLFKYIYIYIPQGRRVWRGLNTAFIFVEFSTDFVHRRCPRLNEVKKIA